MVQVDNSVHHKTFIYRVLSSMKLSNEWDDIWNKLTSQMLLRSLVNDLVDHVLIGVLNLRRYESGLGKSILERRLWKIMRLTNTRRQLLRRDWSVLMRNLDERLWRWVVHLMKLRSWHLWHWHIHWYAKNLRHKRLRRSERLRHLWGLVLSHLISIWLSLWNNILHWLCWFRLWNCYTSKLLREHLSNMHMLRLKSIWSSPYSHYHSWPSMMMVLMLMSTWRLLSLILGF